MNNAIEAQKNLKESHDNEVKRITEQLYVVREHLYSFIEMLEVRLVYWADEIIPNILIRSFQYSQSTLELLRL